MPCPIHKEGYPYIFQNKDSELIDETNDIKQKDSEVKE